MNRPKRLHLKREHLFTHYAFLVLLLIVPVLNLIDIFQILTGTYDGSRTLTEHLSVSLPFIAISILFYFRQRQRLNFKEFRIEHSDEEFRRAVEMTADELKWTIKSNKKGFLMANRDGGWIDWCGEMITITSDNKSILINSISDPDARPTVSSFGWDRTNIKTFIKNLEKAKQQK